MTIPHIYKDYGSTSTYIGTQEIITKKRKHVIQQNYLKGWCISQDYVTNLRIGVPVHTNYKESINLCLFCIYEILQIAKIILCWTYSDIKDKTNQI